MHIALKFAYNGKEFNGYARQPQQKTIEGEIIKSLIHNGIIEDTKESNFRSASRTDKGVSALGNVISFKTNSFHRQILHMLNDDLKEIIVYGYTEVNPDFYPRYAVQRRYRYYLRNKNFDEKLIKATGIAFAGEYNFSNFAKIEQFKDPVRSIDNIMINFDENFIIFDFFARTFLWNQIRRIISAIAKVGMGKISKEQIIEALDNPNKKVDFGLAPAHPLILKDIIYNFEFDLEDKFYYLVDDLEKNIIDAL